VPVAKSRAILIEADCWIRSASPTIAASAITTTAF
jgi:hypothetical protein